MSTHLMNNYGNRALSLVKGEGRYVWDSDGTRYLDALMGIAVCGLGHAHPDITEVISRQASTLVHVSNFYTIPQQEELAARLCSVTGMDKVFFSNSGAEANEAAIKLARLHARTKGIAIPRVLVMEGCFHGRTLATLSATSAARAREGFEPLVENFTHLPFGDTEAVVAMANDPSVVAVMVEPVQGEAGINIPPADYLAKLRALCDQHGWLLILDEVQTGNGRTGTHFAMSSAGITPDILTTAKGLGNGVPIGACLATGAAADLFSPGSHGSTYGGNPLVCAVANRVFDIIQEENLSSRAAALGEQLRQEFVSRLNGIDLVADIRNSGLMLALEMTRDCTDLRALAAESGLLINVTGGNRVRLLPALNMTDVESEELVEKLCSVISTWAHTREHAA